MEGWEKAISFSFLLRKMKITLTFSKCSESFPCAWYFIMILLMHCIEVSLHHLVDIPFASLHSEHSKHCRTFQSNDPPPNAAPAQVQGPPPNFLLKMKQIY
jgi:hypothetical protein